MSGGAHRAFVEPPPVWQQRCRGLRWTDMPGGDTVLQKIHFALWRRGLVRVITDGAAPTGHRLGGRLLPGWGKEAPDGEETTSALGQDVDTEMDVSEAPGGGADAGAGAAADAVARPGQGGALEADAREKGKTDASTAAGRAAARRRRTQMRLNAMSQKGERAAGARAGQGSRNMRGDLPGLLRLAERIRVAAEAAGLTTAEAARLGGITCGSLKPSQLARCGPAQRARMAALAEQLVQRNHQTREGA